MSSKLVKNSYRKQADDSRIQHEFWSEKELISPSVFYVSSFEPGIQETQQKQMAAKLFQKS